MTAVYSWVRILAVYLLFVSVLLSILHNSPFQKYVQLFAGLFLILLAVRSFSSFLGEIDMEDMLSEIEDIDDFSEKLSGAETMEEDFFKEEIQKEAEKQIKELCEKQDYQLKKAELKLTKAYEIKSIKIKLKKRKNQTNPQEQPNIEQLKNKIADCLGVPIENISCKFS